MISNLWPAWGWFQRSSRYIPSQMPAAAGRNSSSRTMEERIFRDGFWEPCLADGLAQDGMLMKLRTGEKLGGVLWRRMGQWARKAGPEGHKQGKI